MTPTPAVFAPVLALSLLLFAWSCYRRIRLVALGGPEDRSSRPGGRIGRMLAYAFGQIRVLSRPFGVNHFLIFWSFMVLLLANTEFLLNGLFPAVAFSRLPEAVYGVFVFAFDVVSLVALVAVIIALGRRLLFTPPYLETEYVKARSLDAFLILSFIAVLILAYFGKHGAEIALGREVARASMPVSGIAATLLSRVPTPALDLLSGLFWWIHAIVLLVFLNYLPFGKHMHILTAIPNCFFQSRTRPNTQPQERFAKGAVYGAPDVSKLTWHDLFDSFTCTECGRCQEACPATQTGKPLNPRQVVHDIKENLLRNGPALRRGDAPKLPLIGGGGEGSIAEDALWACTTCGACMEACPVFIEQMPKIIRMRRHLVQTEARFPEELLNLFENMEQRSNPWGIAPSERTKWASQLKVKPFVAGETEYLFYVGCAGATDSHGKQVAVAIAMLLDAAGVSWGILGREEKCCGDSMRRLGNEYVFDRMTRENVAFLKDRKVSKVITYCPHCYSTLKNDYRQYGLELEVVHHSELLQRLLAEGRLQLPGAASDQGRIVFHDSCYMGRHNGVYEPPRDAIARATGARPMEMERNHERSFCCGAGGGRMWMEESLGTRINLNRVKEAVSKRPDTVCVICPYCMTMFEDGLKDTGVKNVRVKDLAEVVAERLRKQ